MPTEKQATDMWCPMVRSLGDGVAGDNTYTRSNGEVERNPHYARCIASQCAMWRWSDIPSRRYRPTDDLVASEDEAGGRNMKWVPDDWEFTADEKWSGWVEPQYSADARRTGYCGLAGAPMEIEIKHQKEVS